MGRPRLVSRNPFKERPSLVKRKGSLVSRIDTGNESIDEFANRTSDKIKSSDNVGDVFCKMQETIDEMSEEKGAGVDQAEDETKKILTIGDKTLITPKSYVTEKPEIQYNIFDENGEPDYCNGGEGFIQWVNDHVWSSVYPTGQGVKQWMPVHSLPSEPNPETGKSYEMLWWTQQEIVRLALEMVMHENIGRLKNRNIIFCWQRGEGKSFLACLIQLWKFFNFPEQLIMLGANSKEQTKFVHFDIMTNIIYNSPDLREAMGDKKNIQVKEIRFRTLDGNIRSIIRSISTATGIVSNITGYTFSEIFQMKKPDFYVQLDGSIRGVQNALGVIDSTVSDKTHVLYQLFSNFIQGKLKEVFFSHRFSKTGNTEDYMHPYMTKEQLSDYRVKFPFGEYERYFLNTWEAGRQRLFEDYAIEAIKVIGYQGGIMNSNDIFEAMKRKNELKDLAADNQKKGFESDYPVRKIIEIENGCKFISDLVVFDSKGMASFKMIEELTEFFDTDWALLAGADLADPTATNERERARSILTLNLKGLIGSRSNPYAAQLAEAAPKWLYIKVGIFDITTHNIDNVKEILDLINDEFDGIDTLTVEKYRAWDFGKWCDERQIKYEIIHPNYDKQREAFGELYLVIKEGRMKCPDVPIIGSKTSDLYREELSVFDHDSDKRAFGSPEKREKGGIQDDSIYADAWCIYGGRDIGIDNFRIRKSDSNFGFCYNDKSLLGSY